MIERISTDVVDGMGREYSEVMAVLRSRVDDVDGAIKVELDAFMSGGGSEAMSGVWIVVVDKGWCFMRVGAGVEVVGSEGAREDVKKRVRDVGERVRDTLLPIRAVE